MLDSSIACFGVSMDRRFTTYTPACLATVWSQGLGSLVVKRNPRDGRRIAEVRLPLFGLSPSAPSDGSPRLLGKSLTDLGNISARTEPSLGNSLV